MSVTADRWIGTEIAGYRIESLIGRGGMSTVYRAEDLTLVRKVALKWISPELSEDEEFRERFRAEWRLAASIDHPNVSGLDVTLTHGPCPKRPFVALGERPPRQRNRPAVQKAATGRLRWSRFAEAAAAIVSLVRATRSPLLPP